MIKSELLSIAHAAMIQQVSKLSKNCAEANQRLFQIGEQMGLRASDECPNISSNCIELKDKTVAVLKAVALEFLGCQIEILNSQTKMTKGRLSICIRCAFKDNPLCDWVVLSKDQICKTDPTQTLQYPAVILGFLSGTLKTMAYNPTVTLARDSLVESAGYEGEGLQSKVDTIVDIDIWKVVSEE